MPDGVDSFARRAYGHHLARQQKVRISLVLRAAHPPAKLIQIGQSETIGTINDDRVGVRDIESALDDRRADQHIDLARDETLHDRFQFVGMHLAMAKLDSRLGT